jgi:hypothetical protein
LEFVLLKKEETEEKKQTIKVKIKTRRAAEIFSGFVFFSYDIYTHPLCPPLEQLYLCGSYFMMFGEGE